MEVAFIESKGLAKDVCVKHVFHSLCRPYCVCVGSSRMYLTLLQWRCFSFPFLAVDVVADTISLFLKVQFLERIFVVK